MAEEAFALSPISARAALPSEEDYAAISEAFMETSRGRWFLGEYAKRNRNADTSMVLDAVARIEQSLAAQRQATAEADAEAGLAEARLAEAELAEAKLAEVADRASRCHRSRAGLSSRRRSTPGAGAETRAGPQGRAGDPGNLLAAARDRQ